MEFQSKRRPIWNRVETPADAGVGSRLKSAAVDDPMTRFSEGLPLRSLSVGVLAWPGAFALKPTVASTDQGLITKAAKGINNGVEAVVEGGEVVGEETVDGAQAVREGARKTPRPS